MVRPKSDTEDSVQVFHVSAGTGACPSTLRLHTSKKLGQKGRQDFNQGTATKVAAIPSSAEAL